MNNKSKIRAVARSIGTKSTIAIIIAFLLTIAATCVGGYWLYRAIKQDMQLQGKVNAVQAAKEYVCPGKQGFIHYKNDICFPNLPLLRIKRYQLF